MKIIDIKESGVYRGRRNTNDFTIIVEGFYPFLNVVTSFNNVTNSVEEDGIGNLIHLLDFEKLSNVTTTNYDPIDIKVFELADPSYGKTYNLGISLTSAAINEMLNSETSLEEMGENIKQSFKHLITSHKWS